MARNALITLGLLVTLIVGMVPTSSHCQDSTEKHADTLKRGFKEIPGEFIVTFANADTDVQVSYILSALQGQNLVNQDTRLRAVNYLKEFFSCFQNLTPDDVKYIGEKRMVLHLDSASVKEAKKDPHFKSVTPNYMVLKPYGFDFKPPMPAPPNAQPSQVVDWGVRSVVQSVRKNMVFKNTVWVIDSGIDPNHEDLNVDKTRCRSFLPNVGYDQVANEDSHGTHVAGIIGAKNNNVGTVGVAPGIRIVAFKVILNGVLPDYDAYLLALEAVLEEAAPGDVVNISIQNTPGTQDEIDDILKIGKKGVFVALAAGNDRVDINDSKVYPALIRGTNIYCVSACDSLAQFSDFSNYGQLSLAYLAPGSHIYSCLPNNSYGFADGTSMAAPHVAGLLALLHAVSAGPKILCPFDNKLYVTAHE
jgi:hypothetical protein